MGLTNAHWLLCSTGGYQIVAVEGRSAVFVFGIDIKLVCVHVVIEVAKSFDVLSIFN